MKKNKIIDDDKFSAAVSINLGLLLIAGWLYDLLQLDTFFITPLVIAVCIIGLAIMRMITNKIEEETAEEERKRKEKEAQENYSYKLWNEIRTRSIAIGAVDYYKEHPDASKEEIEGCVDAMIEQISVKSIRGY